MTLENKRMIANAYQAAWYACKGEPVRVNVCSAGFFSITGEQGYICSMRVRALLMSLAAMTEEMAFKREISETKGA